MMPQLANEKHLVYLVRFPITTRIRFMKPHLRICHMLTVTYLLWGTTYGVKTAQDSAQRPRHSSRSLAAAAIMKRVPVGDVQTRKAIKRTYATTTVISLDNAHIRPYPRIPMLLRYMMITSQRRPSTKRLIVRPL